jgi:hypothetical protein
VLESLSTFLALLVALWLLRGELKSRADARAAQARLISARFVEWIVENEELVRLTAKVSNDSGAPIRNVVVIFSPRGNPELVSTLPPQAVVRLGEQHSAQWASFPRIPWKGDAVSSVELRVSFLDNQGLLRQSRRCAGRPMAAMWARPSWQASPALRRRVPWERIRGGRAAASPS